MLRNDRDPDPLPLKRCSLQGFDSKSTWRDRAVTKRAPLKCNATLANEEHRRICKKPMRFRHRGARTPFRLFVAGFVSLAFICIVFGEATTTSHPTTFPATAPTLVGLAEGTYLSNAIGQISPAANGRGMSFTFDLAGHKSTVTLLPNLNLMRMEATIDSHGRNSRFLVSGVLTQYQGRNFLLVDRVTEADTPTATAPSTPADQ
jgi:hypothetical protein